MPSQSRPPGRHAIRLLILATIIAVTSALSPRAAAAQCTTSLPLIGPCNPSYNTSQGATNQRVVMTIVNEVAIVQNLNPSVTCSGYVTSCSVSNSVLTIPANGSATDTVIYATSTSRMAGKATFHASSDSSILTVNPPAHAAHEPSILSLPWYNDDNRQPALCAADCFDKVLSYATPAYYTLDTPRSATLFYRSSTASPMVTVQVSANDSSTSRPWKMSLKVHISTGALITFTNGSTEMFFKDSTSNTTERLAAQFAPAAGDTMTGAYSYTAIVTKYWADGTVIPDSIPLRVLLENERSSVFGAGWTIAGQQKVYRQADGSVVITDGTGSISYFKVTVANCTYSCTFTSPTGDYTVLTTRDSLSNAPLFTRRYPDGTYFQFHGNGTLFQLHDKTGVNTTFYYYDSQNRDSLIVDPMGKALHFVYGTGTDGWKAGAIRKVYFDGGQVSWFGVDTTNNLDQIEDPLGNQYGGILVTVNARYDSKHRMISNIDRHQGTWRFGYDFASKLRADSTPAVLADGTTQPVVILYQSVDSTVLINPSSTLGSSTNPAPFMSNGPWWAAANDGEGHRTAWTNDRWGQPLTLNDAGGGTTTFTRVGVFPTNIAYPWGGVDTLTYVGGLLTYEHDAGKAATTYLYNNTFGIADSSFGAQQASMRRFVNAAGNVDSVHVAGSYATRYYYDSRGRDTLTIDPKGHTTHYAYDAATGNRDSTLQSGGRFTRRHFDAYGRDSADAATNRPTAITLYDFLNRVTLTYGGAYADTTRYGYDSLYLVSTTDAKGQTYRRAVNALGWVTREYGAGDSVGIGYLYDKDGLQTSITNRRGQSMAFVYDSLHRLRSKSGTGVTTASFAYSANRRIIVGSNTVSTDSVFISSSAWTDSIVTTLSNGKRFRIRYAPTASQQLDSVDVATTSGITFAGRKLVWDSTTSLLSSVRIAGTYGVTLFYDPEGLLESTDYLPSSRGGYRLDEHVATHAVYSTSFGINGSVADPTVDSAFSRYYLYDPLYRITQATAKTQGHWSVTAYSYDSLAHLARTDQYTKTGNCAAADSTYGVNCASGGTMQSGASVIDGLDQVADDTLSQSDLGVLFGRWTFAAGNRVSQRDSGSVHDTTRYTTDADGNVVRRHDGSHDVRYGWSADGQLITDTAVASSQVLQYGYNAFGRLAVRTRNGTTDRYFLWDGDQLLAELDGSATSRVAEYVYQPGSGSPVAIVTGATSIARVRYEQEDMLGNVMGLSVPDTVWQTRTYDAWGLRVAQTGTVGDTNRLAWKGQLWEGDSTQLYYLRNRWYDPRQERFMSEDPTGLAGGINLYAFADGDPINATDFYGLDGGGGPCSTGTGGGGGNGGGDSTSHQPPNTNGGGPPTYAGSGCDMPSGPTPCGAHSTPVQVNNGTWACRGNNRFKSNQQRQAYMDCVNNDYTIGGVNTLTVAAALSFVPLLNLKTPFDFVPPGASDFTSLDRRLPTILKPDIEGGATVVRGTFGRTKYIGRYGTIAVAVGGFATAYAATGIIRCAVVASGIGGD